MFIRRIWPASSAYRAGLTDPAQLRRDLDRWFDLFAPGESPGAGLFPAVNVTHNRDRYIVRAELPGARAADLHVSVERNKVSISGKRDIAEEGDGVSYHRRERSGGAFSRSLALPEELNADAVEATYKDGVLTVVLPKSERAKARKIEVHAG